MLVKEISHKISSAQLGKGSTFAFCKKKKDFTSLFQDYLTVIKSHIPHTLMCYAESLCLHQAQNFIIYAYSDLDPRYFSKPTTQWMRWLNYSTK